MRVLGIGYTGYHDSSICLVENGNLVYAVAEERISRKSHDAAFPLKAIKHAFQYLNLTPSDINLVALSMPAPLQHIAKEMTCILSSGNLFKNLVNFAYAKTRSVINRGGYAEFVNEFGNIPVVYSDHHLAHAISAYACSGLTDATVVVIDGRGSYEASSIWRASDGKLRPVEIIHYPNSLGLFYAKFTKYLGFVPLSDEWKVMGLAAYGKSGFDLSPFIGHDGKHYRINHKLLNSNNFKDVTGIESKLGPQRDPASEITDMHRDVAFSVQRETEKAVLALIDYAVQKTGCKNVCLAGGVALNCKANGLIAQSGKIQKLFIQPAAADDGTALGAALYGHMIINKKLPLFQMGHAYWGPEFTSKQIEQTLLAYKIPFLRLATNAPDKIAELLADGKIVGLFQGRMEFGPRGLGNRSILADPRDDSMKDKVNDSVKYRENWRPFAPSILEEYYHAFFDTEIDSPFMILSFPLKKNCSYRISAAVHVDQTARPQSVSRSTNPYYWDIISAFHKKTGVPAVLNTSFNLKGEPIVCSPFDAIRTFYTSGLDALVLNDFLILKNSPSAS